MKTVLKITGEIVLGFGFLFGLVRGAIITQETAVTVGLLAVLFILCFEEVKKQFHPLNNALAEIQRFLGKRWKFIPLHEIKPAGFIQENSPLTITTIGEKLLQESGGKKMIEDYYNDFENRINQKNPQAAYDVQNEASSIIAEVENESYMKPIKDFLYNHPKFNEQPLTINDIQRVMVIYLRDLYLKKHPILK